MLKVAQCLARCHVYVQDASWQGAGKMVLFDMVLAKSTWLCGYILYEFRLYVLDPRTYWDE